MNVKGTEISDIKNHIDKDINLKAEVLEVSELITPGGGRQAYRNMVVADESSSCTIKVYKASANFTTGKTYFFTNIIAKKFGAVMTAKSHAFQMRK